MLLYYVLCFSVRVVHKCLDIDVSMMLNILTQLCYVSYEYTPS